MTIPPGIRVIFFDADDTLFVVRGSVGTIYSAKLAEFGHCVTPAEIDQHVPDFWREFRPLYLNAEEGYATSPARERMIWREFAQRLCRKFGALERFDEFFEVVYQEFGKARSRELLPDVESTLRALREQGYQLGVLSNNDRRVLSVLEEFGLLPLFDFALPTAEIGFKKPAARCFEVAAGRAGRPATELVYIGDNLVDDYHAARSAGWSAIWFNPKASETPNGVERQIQQFGELLIR